MKTEQFTVSNVKCGGCVANIKKGLSVIPGVQEIDVEIKSGKVVVNGENVDRSALASKLKEIGYPEKA